MVTFVNRECCVSNFIGLQMYFYCCCSNNQLWDACEIYLITLAYTSIIHIQSLCCQFLKFSAFLKTMFAYEIMVVGGIRVEMFPLSAKCHLSGVV